MTTRFLAATLLLMGCGPARSTDEDPVRSETMGEPSVAEPPKADKPEGPAETQSEPVSAPVATAKPEPEPEPATAPTFSVIARLVDAGTPTSHCGVVHYKVVMKYEVLRVVDGHFEGETLYTGVSCPEMPPTRTRKFRFEVGNDYELKLRTAGLRRQGAKVDAFEGEPGKRYELLHIEPAPSPRRYTAK